MGLLVVGSVNAAELPPAKPAPAPAELLDRAGKRVKDFWDQMASVTCTEALVQEKMNEKGKVAVSARSSYDYLISMRWDGQGLMVDESRIPIGSPLKKTPQGALLSTQGFATLILIFHPEFQSGFSFAVDGMEPGTALIRVAFVAKKGGVSPAALSLKDRTYPIAWEGVAWMDPNEGVITKIQAHWKDPAEEIGLKNLSSEVNYVPIIFRGGERAWWLPEKARVDVKTVHQEWRNTHQFTNYRLFSVETRTKIGDSDK
jgi:hypothetical protein